MTTWHNNETLDDVLYFFLTTSWPAESYRDSARSSLAITIQGDSIALQIRVALADPRAFIARLDDADDDSDQERR